MAPVPATLALGGPRVDISTANCKNFTPTREGPVDNILQSRAGLGIPDFEVDSGPVAIFGMAYKAWERGDGGDGTKWRGLEVLLDFLTDSASGGYKVASRNGMVKYLDE